MTSQEKTEYCLDNVTDRCCTGSPEGITASGSADSSSGATNSTVTVSGTNVTATATGTATAAAAANQAKGEDGSSNSTIPLIVGGIIGGLVLLGLIIGILTYLRKKRAANGTVGTGFGGGASGSAPSGKLMGGSNSPEVMRVVYDYVPNLFDEIHLYAGDQIEVKAKFDDGWAYGLNLTSKKEGSFPLACVESLSGIKGASSVASSPSKNNIRQRASSLYVGKQY